MRSPRSLAWRRRNGNGDTSDGDGARVAGQRMEVSAVVTPHRSDAHQRLDRALMELSEANEDVMTLSELDGFCTGLILCPEPVLVRHRLSEIWGGVSALDFESEEGFRSLVDLVMDHHACIVWALRTSDSYQPVMVWHQERGAVLLCDWIRGFIRAASLNPDGWKTIVASDDENFRRAFSLLLEMPVLGTPACLLNSTVQVEMLEKAPELITGLVYELNRCRRSRANFRSARILPFSGRSIVPETGTG